MGHWLWVHAGIDGSGPWYAWWSGAGSDITELAMLGGIIQLARHRNCHVRGCWRFGTPVRDSAFLACHKHHPDHPGDARNVTEEQIAQVVR